MRVGVLSDTHLSTAREAIALRESLAEVFEGVELILHAGDLVTYDVVEELGRIAETVAVSGNMDHLAASTSLPERRVVEAASAKIGLIHGSGPPQGLPDRVFGQFSGVDCVVFGHSHHPFNRLAGDILLFNPGSPTDKRFAPFNSVGILDIGSQIRGTIRRLDRLVLPPR